MTWSGESAVHSLLLDVVGSYLDAITEREFDATFIVILRALNFYDVHQTHGAYEFGKDFVAKRRVEGAEYQCSFQTKAGNIGLAEWREARTQIDDMRTNNLAHPSFDATLERASYFVTTGRLTGAANLASQQYKDHLANLGEASFDVWEREDLVQMLALQPEMALAGEPETSLLGAVAAIDSDEYGEADLERYSRRWVGPHMWRGSLVAAVLANRFRRRDRLDLAAWCGLCLIRGIWASVHGSMPPPAEASAVADIGAAIFRAYALEIVDRAEGLSAEDLVFASSDLPAGPVTYPVLAIRVAEVLGLLGLLYENREPQGARQLADRLAECVASQPAAVHPISDHWAGSLVPPALLLFRFRFDALIPWLERVVVWLADRYEENEFGLAGPWAGPQREVAYLLGPPFDHVNVPRRSFSYAATVVLDIASICGLRELYEIALNDFLATRMSFCLVETSNGRGQYAIGQEDVNLEINVPYQEPWNPADGWKNAPHHERAPDYYLGKIGRPWDALAVSAVLRDRHFLTIMREWATAPAPRIDFAPEAEAS